MLRAAVPADADALAQFTAGVPGTPVWASTVWESMTSDPRRAVFLVRALESEQVEGVAAVSLLPPAPYESELEAIAIGTRFRRRGLGRQLVLAAQRWVQTKGATVLRLEVRESNASAIGLYIATGFTVAGSRKHYYREPHEDAVLMQWTPGTVPLSVECAGEPQTSGKLKGDYGS